MGEVVMIGYADLKELLTSYGIDYTKVITKNDNVIEYGEYREIKGVLDYLIGMRYHACLLALKYGIPTLALSYDEKVDKIAKRFDLPCSNLEDADKFDELFNELKNLQTSKIMDKVKACRFDFTNILKAINE